MKIPSTTFLRGAALIACFALVLSAWAANKKTSVVRVMNPVTLTEDVDYTITGITPFGDEGVVNIENTDHAVLIFKQVKPTEAKSLLADHVQIAGVKAVDNQNCQVKLYNRGSIVMPYSNSMKPLTVYSGQNFEGTSVNSFGLEHSGGFMNTLSKNQLNNQIRSFKLKRGYMVTFSTLPEGRGYSRCFIAADQDLEVATLPVVLDEKISSYRVFKWYDAGKKQLANSAGDVGALKALNVQSTYDWGQGNGSLAPDIEWVPNHIYEDWPSSSTIGSTTQSPHTKNNNEPRNSADDHPQDLPTILNNWENMMRTGMRLCSPASWDGSDYWNATGFLADFLDSIDARGWRCDIIDLHCYWAEGSFGNIANWVNKYKRPVWISEWCWGASWSSNGAFANGVTNEQVKEALQRICNNLNGYDYVERYFYWNGERDPSRLYKDGKLTSAGEMYAQLDGGMGYNGKYNFVPTTPRQYGPSNFIQTIEGGKTILTWHDNNGEYNQLMELQRKTSTGWEPFGSVEQQEQAADYTYTIDNADKRAKYRLHVIDLNGKEYYTNDDVEVGDLINVDGDEMYVGGNIYVNGDFNLGLYGWTDGKGQPLQAPQFEVVATGGYAGGSYLQAFSNTGADTDGAVRAVSAVEPGKYYYFGAAIKNTGNICGLYFTADGSSTLLKAAATLKNSADWLRQSKVVYTEEYSQVTLAMRNLQAKGQIDKLELRQLFATRDEAIADGAIKTHARAQAVIAWNTRYPQLNAELEMAATPLLDLYDPNIIENLYACEDGIANLMEAVGMLKVAESLQNTIDAMADKKCRNYDDIAAALQAATTATTAEEVISSVSIAKGLMDAGVNFIVSATQPKNGTFASAGGWETKVGTYTGGDQRTNTVGGKTCWNAWWSIAAATNPDATMEVRQTVSGLETGYYVLEAKATTQHLCLSDQHAYIMCDDEVGESPVLEYDYFDLPVSNIWQTLTTTPVFVADGGEVTIGFKSSKNGAHDGYYREFGKTSANADNREGWWCATDFTLRQLPLFQRTAEAGQWQTICLPYDYSPAPGVRLYQIAGINADFTAICVEEVSEAVAGQPCLLLADVADPILYEWGVKTNTPGNGPGGLRGFFNSRPAQTGYYGLKNGEWIKITSANRNDMRLGVGEALLRPFTDKDSHINVLSAWNGLTIPISGITDEEITLLTTQFQGITAPTVSVGSANGTYNAAGQRIPANRSGLRITVKDGKAQKAIIK